MNTSQYDASQGNHSGAQIDVNTATGTNNLHGQAYIYRATNFANADPFFNKQWVLYQQNLPAAYLNPQLHRYTAGGTVGRPVVKDKLFFFLGYQFGRVSDASEGLAQLAVPFGLTNDRSTTGIQNAITSYNALSAAQGVAVQTFNGTFDPVALAILEAKLPNGSYLIPSVTTAVPTSLASGAATSTKTTVSALSLTNTNQVEANLDYNLTNKDHLSAKYYYQHSPVIAPFADSNTAGVPASDDSGAQVGALTNVITMARGLTGSRTMDFSRQKVYSTFNQLVSSGALLV